VRETGTAPRRSLACRATRAPRELELGLPHAAQAEPETTARHLGVRRTAASETGVYNVTEYGANMALQKQRYF
jgi:hypothetical protein